MNLNWFDGLNTKEEMNSMVIGEMEIVMGDLSTTADVKVLEIARSLDRLNKAWNAKKALLQTEPPKENTLFHSTIDVGQVESLVGFPIVERGPSCKICDCFKCNKLPNCHIEFPTTSHFCEKICGGIVGIVRCSFKLKEETVWTLEKIMRNEG